MTSDWSSTQDIKIIAHRGYSGKYPENTMIAFQEALKANADAIELDVYNIQNVLFVFHDDTLSRLTNSTGYFSDLTVEEVDNLKIANLHKIPRLSEVLDLMLIDTKFNLNIELKGRNTAVATADLLKGYINKGIDPNRFLISSFIHSELIDFKNHLPQIKIAALQVSLPISGPQFAADLNCFSVHVSAECVDSKFVDSAHNLGLKVYAFTVNEQIVFERMLAIKIDGIFTDYPDRFISK
jgi:glycerophosphoryl diester phosphodiesterase